MSFQLLEFLHSHQGIIYYTLMTQTVKNLSARSAGDLGFIPRAGISPGGGHGNPPQYSCLENPHGQRRLVSHSPWGRKELDPTEGLSLLLSFLEWFASLKISLRLNKRVYDRELFPCFCPCLPSGFEVLLVLHDQELICCYTLDLFGQGWGIPGPVVRSQLDEH